MGAGALGEIQRMQRLGGEREIRVGWGWQEMVTNHVWIILLYF